jgi:hypothetical protein
MKRNFKCHYESGYLLFYTIRAYPRTKAIQILEVFTSQKLVSAMQPSGHHRFFIVGRLNTHFDPFVSTSLGWQELVVTMKSTLDILEENLKPVCTGVSTTKGKEFIYRRPK